MNELLKLKGIIGISHIALTVPDIDTAWQQFQFFGYVEREDGIIEENDYGIRAKIIYNGSLVVELLSPLGDPDFSPYAEQLKQNRYCLDHICYDVEDLDEVVNLLKKQRFLPISIPRITKVWNRRAVLLANRKMGVVELMEMQK